MRKQRKIEIIETNRTHSTKNDVVEDIDLMDLTAEEWNNNYKEKYIFDDYYIERIAYEDEDGVEVVVMYNRVNIVK